MSSIKWAEVQKEICKGWGAPDDLKKPIDEVVQKMTETIFLVFQESSIKRDIQTKANSLGEDAKTKTLRAVGELSKDAIDAALSALQSQSQEAVSSSANGAPVEEADAEQSGSIEIPKAAEDGSGPQSAQLENALNAMETKIEEGADALQKEFGELFGQLTGEHTAKSTALEGCHALGCYLGRRWDFISGDVFAAAKWIAIPFGCWYLESSIFRRAALGSAIITCYLRYARRNGESAVDEKIKRHLDDDMGTIRTWMHKGRRLHYLAGGMAILWITQTFPVRLIVPKDLRRGGTLVVTGLAGLMAGNWLAMPLPVPRPSTDDSLT